MEREHVKRERVRERKIYGERTCKREKNIWRENM